MPNPDYMDDQKDLQWKMRGILVDWLVEVHHKFRLLPETLFLAINIIDRFLSLRVVSLQKLQLVGLTSMFIASKYEEVMAPSIQNFIYMADGGYTDEEILKAERYILQVLEFGLHYPNPLNFLRRCSKADNYDIQTRTLAKYLMEVALVDHRFLQYPPSNVAASSLYLSRTMLDRPEWVRSLRHWRMHAFHLLLTLSLFLAGRELAALLGLHRRADEADRGPHARLPEEADQARGSLQEVREQEVHEGEHLCQGLDREAAEGGAEKQGSGGIRVGTRIGGLLNASTFFTGHDTLCAFNERSGFGLDSSQTLHHIPSTSLTQQHL
jgi:hypothetical protein